MTKQQRTIANALRARLSAREHITPRGTLSDYKIVYDCYMSEEYSAIHPPRRRVLYAAQPN